MLFTLSTFRSRCFFFVRSRNISGTPTHTWFPIPRTLSTCPFHTQAPITCEQSHHIPVRTEGAGALNHPRRSSVSNHRLDYILEEGDLLSTSAPPLAPFPCDCGSRRSPLHISLTLIDSIVSFVFFFFVFQRGELGIRKGLTRSFLLFGHWPSAVGTWCHHRDYRPPPSFRAHTHGVEGKGG